MEYPKFKVSVSCMTYNQSKYITDAMNGFTMQQTSFPFVCTIVDDASTDGEQEVIRKYVEENFDFSEGSVAYQKETDYAHITYAQHKTNKNCYFAVLYLKENHYSQKKDKSPYLKEWRDGVEYMALCEGDDYWLLSDKLQKQYEMMERYPRMTLCTTAGVMKYPSGDFEYVNKYSCDLVSCPPEDVIFSTPGFLLTCSLFYRIKVLPSPLPLWVTECPVGDRPLQLMLLSRGTIGYINILASCYRVAANGSWTLSMSRKKRVVHYIKMRKMWKSFNKWSEYKYSPIIIRRILNNDIYLVKELIHWGFS